MKIDKLALEFGRDAQNRTGEVSSKKFEGALAGLESFYYSFNNRSADTLMKVWHNSGLIQLNNPIGGIVRGATSIAEIYDRIFNGQASVWVKFTDIVYYATDDMVVFAGTEIGEFSANEEAMHLKIRTTRCFGYLGKEGHWVQLHHHGSIDDPELLQRYQTTVRK